MRVNSEIDFIQASGGNMLETHHIEFETVAEEPTTPSGSVWFDPNDDLARANETRTEHLKYQTASGIRELRIDEGLSAYHFVPVFFTTFPLSIPGNFGMNFSGIVDNKFYDQFDDTFAVKASGLYRISYQLAIRNLSSGGNNDGVNAVRCLRNGVEIPQSVAHYYQDGSTSVAQASKTFLTNLDLEDSIVFEWSIIAAGGNSYDWISPTSTFICFEFIRRTDHAI